MEASAVQEIIECLPRGRTMWHYFADRYALLLLQWSLRDGIRVSELRKGPFNPLLEKPLVRQALSRAGDGMLRPQHLMTFWPSVHQTMLLTLGTWGPEQGFERWRQTTTGRYNLVLHLNFTERERRSHRALFRYDDDGLSSMECWIHPHSTRGLDTLSWVRLELSLDTGEALIEEVQNDWLRFSKQSRQWLNDRRWSRRELRWSYLENVQIEDVERYWRQVCQPLEKIWTEMTLCAAIWFLREELGIRTIYYHTYDSGLRLKRMDGQDPPRSIYTTLPRKFCFQRDTQGPQFLENAWSRRFRRLRREAELEWFVLRL